MNAVLIPHPAIGKSDLAAERLVALRDAHVVDKRCHTIGVIHAESWIARGERQHVSPTAIERIKCLVRNFTNGCTVGRGTRYGGFSHALLPPSSAHQFYIARNNDRFWRMRGSPRSRRGECLLVALTGRESRGD
jgi:hypothetical protein